MPTRIIGACSDCCKKEELAFTLAYADFLGTSVEITRIREIGTYFYHHRFLTPPILRITLVRTDYTELVKTYDMSDFCYNTNARNTLLKDEDINDRTTLSTSPIFYMPTMGQELLSDGTHRVINRFEHANVQLSPGRYGFYPSLSGEFVWEIPQTNSIAYAPRGTEGVINNFFYS